MLPRNAMLNPGERLGEYEILEHLRAGGMASLYRARRVGAAGFARDVAIKVVHPHLALDPMFVRMFVDEALLSVRIQHANVVHVEALGKHASTYFLVMALVRGRSLAQLSARLAERGARLRPELAVQIAVAAADGLHAAHETRDDDGTLLGVVHRDVSPQNVLVGDDGHVRLIDFGIAKARGQLRETASGELRGKVRYMAPEQARGEAVDRRADVFALGLVAWELLAGERFFEGASDADVLSRLQQPLDIPTVGDAKLDAVLARALARSPDDRFATARELRRALVEAMPSSALLDAEALTAEMRSLFDRPEDARAFPSIATTPLPADADAVTAPPTPSSRRAAAQAPAPEPARFEPAPIAPAQIAPAQIAPIPAPARTTAPARPFRLAIGITLVVLSVAAAGLAWSARGGAPATAHATAPPAAPISAPLTPPPAAPPPVEALAPTPQPAGDTVVMPAQPRAETARPRRPRGSARESEAAPTAPRIMDGVPIAPVGEF